MFGSRSRHWRPKAKVKHPPAAQPAGCVNLYLSINVPGPARQWLRCTAGPQIAPETLNAYYTPPEPSRLQRRMIMAKGYWVATYRSISNPDAVAAYGKLAAPAILAGGGKFLARGNPAKTYESGQMQRVVVIEFPSVEQATKTHDSPAYQEALKVLAKGADRDIRIVEGVE
jgi:uncharacterized protein (DUF1330 family)